MSRIIKLNRFVGPTELLVSGDTLQLKDYSKLDWEWSMFDPEAKKRRHETVFPQECAMACGASQFHMPYSRVVIGGDIWYTFFVVESGKFIVAADKL